MEIRKPAGFSCAAGAANLPFQSNKKDLIESPSLEQKMEAAYDDPLMSWPIRGLAYSNEIGVAISEIAPALGLALWIPALMYIGADIYDKYKNEDTSYNPSSQRGLKQAVFQGLASVSLPSLAIIAGQKVFSLLGFIAKGGLSINSREKISNYAIEFVTSGHLAKYAQNDDECKKSFVNSLTNNLNYKKHEKKMQDFKAWFISFIRNPGKTLAFPPSAEKSKNYANSTIDKLIALRKELYGNIPQTKNNLKWHKFVEKKMQDGIAKDVAIRNAVVEFQKLQVLKGKWIKTLGGFIALAAAAKPIDIFVQHVILPKYVDPGLNKLGINTPPAVKQQSDNEAAAQSAGNGA